MVAPGIIVAPSYENFYIMILLLFYINLGIAVIFKFFFLRNFSKINNSRATTIQEVKVYDSVVTVMQLHRLSGGIQKIFTLQL